MPVKKNRGAPGDVLGFGVNERVKLGGDDFDLFHSGVAQFFGQPLCGALDVGLIFGLGTDARNAQKFRQLREILVAVILDVIKKTHSYAPRRTTKMAAGDVRCVSNGSAFPKTQTV